MNNFQNLGNSFQFNNIPNFLNFPTMPNMNNFQSLNNNMQNMSQQQPFLSLPYIKSEFDNIYTNPMSNLGLSVGLIHENDYTKWRITLTGPRDTPYSGGIYKIMINFPNNYPSAPPLIYFITPIYHLNINPYWNGNNIGDPLGFVPIERLNFWKPEYSIKEVLTYVYGLFYFVDLDCAYGDERKIEYLHDRGTYVEKIKYFVRKYAGTSNFSLDWANNMSWNFQVY